MFRLEKLEISGFKSFADRVSLNFGEGITAVVGPNGCGKCLSGDTLVTLADGRDVPIRELVEAAFDGSGNVESLDDGFVTRQNPRRIEILSLDPATLRLEARPVAAFIKREATLHLLRVRTRAGREVTATPYHPLFTLENGRLRALRADELKPGIRLALPRKLSVTASSPEMSPLTAVNSFRLEDRVFVPYSDSLRAWADEEHKKFGTWAGWTRAASVSVTEFKGLSSKQAVNAATISKLARTAETPPPIDVRLKSRGSGQLRLPSVFTPDLARFLGLLIAEGRNTNSNQVWLISSDPAINDEYQRLAGKLFGVEVRRLHYKPNADDNLIFSSALCKTLERLFNFPIDSNSAAKEVPSQVFEADAETQWAFLSGLFEGDAYVSVLSNSGNPRPPYIEYVTASSKLAQQVVALLLRAGVFAILRPRQKYASNTADKRKRTYYSVLIYGVEQLRHAARHLSFVGEKRAALEALRQLDCASNPNHDLIPGVTPIVKEASRRAGVKIKANRRGRPKLAAYVENRCEASRSGLLEVIHQIEQLGATPELAREHLSRLRTLATSDVYWDEIVSVEQVEPPDPWVYDLSIAETHNFVAGNIIVHNSNISDAISWVLGEQSAKSLRGAKMEDVIFNGTRDRKPTGMSEVLLTLVAIEDIAARNDEVAEKDIEQEYEDAISTAEQAATAARSLVQEMTPPEDSSVAAEQSESVSTSQTAQTIEPAQTIESDQSQDSAQAEPSASVSHEPPTAHFSLPQDMNIDAGEDQSADSSGATDAVAGAEQNQADGSQKKAKQAERNHPPARRRRRAVAISAGERITVGRRLYRTGDSEYLMNGRPCLLRDIQDLFAGTGLGGAHYAIIEQGRIGQILSSKPLDRRALIEEAAGITKFKSRKRAAELKLESAKQNLTRLNDIISEVERQVNSLKRQAQKARRYRRLREEMRSFMKVVFTVDYYRLNEAVERIARELEEAERNQSEFDAQLAERESEHRVVSTEARAMEDRLTGLREQAASLELEADRARNRRAFEQQQISEITARIEEINKDQAALEQRLSVLDEESQRRAADFISLETELSAEQAELLNRERLYQQELARLRESESEIEQLRLRMLTEIGITERLRNLSASLEDELRKLGLKQSSLDAELERATARHEETAGEYERISGEVEGDAARLADLTERIAGRASELLELRNSGASLRDELEEIHAGRTSGEQRLTSLEDLDAHHAYYSDAVQQVLSPEQAARINALGTLADFVEVEAAYERLIESLFGRELQSVLVPTIDDALAGVDFIKSEDLGRGAFLVVGLHGGEGDPDGQPDSRNAFDESPSSGVNNRESQSRGVAESNQANGIEQWLIATDAELEAMLFHEEYIPEERQLPPADFSDFDAIVIPLNEDVQPPISDSRVEPEAPQLDDRRSARQFDEEDARQASRFQLDVLRAIDLLGLRPEIKTVVERAFPEKCAASVVPDMEAALQLSIENPSRVYVTYEGEQVVNGRLIVTSAQAGKKNTSLLGLKREIKQLRVQVAMLREEENRVNLSLIDIERRREGLEGEATLLDRELREHEKTAAARNSQFEGVARDLERAAQHVRVVEAELEQARGERAELESRIEQLSTELRAAEASREEVQSAVASAQAALVEMRARIESLSDELSSARASVAARAERLQAAKAELRRIENEAEELRSRINRNRLELYESHNRVEQLAASHAEGSIATARFESEGAALGEQISAATEELVTARARADELEAILSELRQAVSAAHDRRGEIQVERARIEAEAEHLARTCFSELAMSLEDVVTSVELGRAAKRQLAEGSRQLAVQSDSVPAGDSNSDVADDHSQMAEAINDQELPSANCLLPTDSDAARARLDELRVKLDEMGPVNMMALEELEESEERFKFLTEQRRDILDSIKMTEEALAEIKRRSRERFRHAFTHINENFQHMFTELFGGGRGEMIMIDEDDVLESGIDLIAQPPGKRLQNVLLLSGGEKAMAAIALVLAIFQYRPSPFCILDEVDAPLDEINVGRFSDKVIEMSTTTQFLVITHNKRTMEAARALYGVTMEEPGVSKLVSVKFE